MRFLRLLLIAGHVALALGLVASAARFPVVALGLAVAGACWLRRRRRAFATHGTASWGTWSDCGPLFGGGGVPAGMLFDKPSVWAAVRTLFDLRLPGRDAVAWFAAAWGKGVWRRIRLNTSTHVAIFGPTGTGKSSAVTIPYLLTCPDSMVCFSPKPDEYLRTAAARREMGQRVVLLDPFGTVPGVAGDTLNPLSAIDPHAESAVDDVRDIGGVLVPPNPHAHDPFFDTAARAAVAGFTGAAVAHLEPHEREPGNVRRLLADPDKFAEVVKAMRGSSAWGGALATSGDALAQLTGKTLSGVQATASNALNFLDTPAVRRATARSSFDPAGAFRAGCTVYIIVPPNRLQEQMPLVRLWLRTLLVAAAADGPQEDRIVRFVIEEAGQLGPMDIIDKTLNVMRGYGLRLLLLYQNVGSLLKCFPEGQDQVVLGNVTQVYLGTNDYKTAEAVANRLGDYTEVSSSGGSTHGRSNQTAAQGGSHGASTSAADNWSLTARKLLQPSEVLALDPRRAVVFAPGRKPLLTWTDRYYEHAIDGATRLGLAVRVLALALATGLAVALATVPPPTPRYHPVAPSPEEVPHGPAFEPGPPAAGSGTPARATGPAQPGARAGVQRGGPRTRPSSQNGHP